MTTFVPDLRISPPESSDVLTPQGELDTAFSEARVVEPVAQFKTKLIFDVVLNDQFLD